MDNNRLPKHTLNYKPWGRRDRGRPRKWWQPSMPEQVEWPNPWRKMMNFWPSYTWFKKVSSSGASSTGRNILIIVWIEKWTTMSSNKRKPILCYNSSGKFGYALIPLHLRKYNIVVNNTNTKKVQICYCSWYQPVILCTNCYTSEFCWIKHSNTRFVLHQPPAVCQDSTSFLSMSIFKPNIEWIKMKAWQRRMKRLKMGNYSSTFCFKVWHTMNNLSLPSLKYFIAQ